MLLEQRGMELCQLQSENSNNKAKKNRRRLKKSTPSIVQQLYQTCKEVFVSGGAGVVPSPQDVERIRLVLVIMMEKHNDSAVLLKNDTLRIVDMSIKLHA
ncbi:Cysteine oxygenase/2-aminoethanethiol dioxygenase [Thalictrum thalictroides]|uniref:Cysteine oxygenase/2-aminoethanethiol dioxygenase n=1 Tax=Thalictrum thalictroides TaxID=46969 RepID=A0A7J6XBR4_THATH|nr:Cysteine oxygenase/2-aminoethanethiol dioxygenase [Thalictrum thalictroides]